MAKSPQTPTPEMLPEISMARNRNTYELFYSEALNPSAVPEQLLHPAPFFSSRYSQSTALPRGLCAFVLYPAKYFTRGLAAGLQHRQKGSWHTFLPITIVPEAVAKSSANPTEGSII